MPSSASVNDPLSSFNYIVDIQGMRAGFSEIGGLTTETARRLPGKRKYTNINLKRGYTSDGKALLAWRKKAMDGKTHRLGGTITLLDEARRPVRIWEFREGWPTKWVGPALNAKNNDVVIEEMELSVEGLVLQPGRESRGAGG